MALTRKDVEALREARPDDDMLRPIPASLLLQPPPPRVWMVEQCFPKGTVAMLSGDGGIGKSTIMQQMLTCAALGVPWLGFNTTPGGGLFFACEDDDDELRRRQRQINYHLDRPMEDVIDGGLHLVGRVGMQNTLARLDRQQWRMAVTDLFTRMLKFCLEQGVSYVVVDTATQTFAGNQNDEQQVVQFINMLRRLAIAIQGVVIITKHPSMSGRALGTGESGNVAWNNSVRSRLYLAEDKAGLAIKGMKSNYGRKVERIPLKWDHGAYARCEVIPTGYGEQDDYN